MEILAGRQALVTGGTSGIGRAIAEALYVAGCSVLAAGQVCEPIESTTKRSGLEFTALDVCDPASIAEIVSRYQRLDILVNCAGTIARDGLEFEMEHFERVLNVNLAGTMRMCTACRPLLESGGSIVNLASMLSFFGSGAAPAYSASKGAVAQLTKSLAIAWAGAGIRVNAIAPGWIETPLTQPLIDDPQRRAAIEARTPLARWGQPRDVAGAAVFLCSPAAAFITGVVLPVDGGYSIA